MNEWKFTELKRYLCGCQPLRKLSDLKSGAFGQATVGILAKRSLSQNSKPAWNAVGLIKGRLVIGRAQIRQQIPPYQVSDLVW